MTEPEHPVVSLTPIDDVTESAQPKRFDDRTVSDTLLRLTDEALQQRLTDSLAVSSQVLEALRRLVEIVAKLRKPDSGWPANLAYTPENLFPYAIEEAYEVLDCLKEISPVCLSPHSPFPISHSQYLLVEDLSLKLLWYVAKSSYYLMQLTEGIPAKVSDRGEAWQTGILRLVAVLTVQTSEMEWSIDLATIQPPQTSLSPTTLIQLRGGDIPQSVEHWRRQVLRQIQASTPEVKLFTETAKVELLEPGKNWQFGRMQLLFEFEFTANEDEVEEEAVQAKYQPLVRLTNKSAIADYARSLLGQELINASTQLVAIAIEAELEERSRLTSIVEVAAAVVTGCVATPPYLAFVQASPLEEWVSRLLWELTRISYETMRLLGGVKAYVLQPDYGWEVGTLRLLAILKAKTSNEDLQLDLSTGQPPTLSSFLLTTDAVIQSAEDDLSQEPDCVNNVLTHLIVQIRETASILKLFLDGTKFELRGADSTWQPGLVQLDLDLEFIPESSKDAEF